MTLNSVEVLGLDRGFEVFDVVVCTVKLMSSSEASSSRPC